MAMLLNQQPGKLMLTDIQVCPLGLGLTLLAMQPDKYLGPAMGHVRGLAAETATRQVGTSWQKGLGSLTLASAD